MIDSSTRQSIQVTGDRAAPALIMLPADQLDAIRHVLDRHRVAYWVDEEYISLNGDPDIAFINFSRDLDPELVQQLLDDAA